MIDILDVSAVQGVIDWERIVASPVAPGVDRRWRGAIVKVTEGPNGRDTRRLEHLAGARRVGLRTGVYHYLYPGDELRCAADGVVLAKRIWDAVGDALPHFRVAIDLEGADASLTPAQLLDRVFWCRDGIARFFGRGPMLYTYLDFYRRRLAPAFATSRELAETVPLWWASYGAGRPWYPTDAEVQRIGVPAPWTAITMLQYSGNDGLHVPGIFGAVDRDLFLGDENAFREFCGLGPEREEEPMAIVHRSPFDDDEPPPTAA